MKNQYKSMYRVVKKPQIFEAQKQTVIAIKGIGGPNTEEFQKCIEALYQLSYAFRMSYKRQIPIENYESYTVGPLEGFWGTIDNKMYDQNKEKLTYELFIVQPKFITKEVFEQYQKEVSLKNDKVLEIEYKINNEGLVGQILHTGPYETEDNSIDILKTKKRVAPNSKENITNVNTIKDIRTKKQILCKTRAQVRLSINTAM